MHGQVGNLTSHTGVYRRAGEFYGSGPAFPGTCRRMGNGGIDHDVYRARARKHRARVMRRLLRRLFARNF